MTEKVGKDERLNGALVYAPYLLIWILMVVAALSNSGAMLFLTILILPLMWTTILAIFSDRVRSYFVRFHAIQSAIIWVLLFVLNIIMSWLVFYISRDISSTRLIASLASLEAIVWILGMEGAYNGFYEFPIVGKLAMKGIMKEMKTNKQKKTETRVDDRSESEPPIKPAKRAYYEKYFPPELLSKYEPLEFLDEGGFARVFKVRRKSDGKIVALKIPRIDERTSKTFIKEVSTWLHLNHPNIVRLYDADILPIPYLEMEYVEGVDINGSTVRDLGSYPKPVEEETALDLIRGVAEGLKHAHGKGIYHRDLKPLNILLNSDLTPKIVDWGLAKLETMSSGRSVFGYTPLYASPEHLMPSKYGQTDYRTDIWQLGVTFYELLTGRHPFEGYTSEEVFGKITDENYRFTPPSEINPALAKYDGIFEKLLAKRKEDRYQSVDEFLKDLEKLAERTEMEKEIEKLRENLSRSIQALKKSTTSEEVLKNRRLVVETLGKLALAYAELNRKAELLATLNDLKFYTVQNLEDLTNAINTVEFLIRDNLSVSGEFIEMLKVLVHNIKRESGG